MAPTNLWSAVSSAYHASHIGSDRAQLSGMAKKAKAAPGAEQFDVVAYFSGEQILVSEQAGVTVTRPKPLTSKPGLPAGSASRASSICPRMTRIAALPARR